MTKPQSPKSPSIGSRIVSAHGNTEGEVLQVDTFVTKSGESTLRVQVQTDHGEVRWITLK